MTCPRGGTWLAAAWLVAAATSLGAAGPARAAEEPSIAGPRPATHVVDEVGLLAAEDVERLERLAAGLGSASGGDLMVVVISSTGGQPHRDCATDLFNRWQLGTAGRDDGLLILVAVDDRRAEIVLGAGVDAAGQVAASQRIMDEVLIPAFRAGRPAAGLRQAALACAAEILGGGAEGSLDVADAAAAEPEFAPVVVPEPAPPPAPGPWRQPRPWAGRPPDVSPLPWLIGGAATAGAGLGGYLLRRHLRNRPRSCPDCGLEMVRLGEQADDPHLAAGERTEERLRSVDYDVWTCPTCPRVTKLRYGRFFTSYSSCPTCRFVTTSRTTRRVISPTTLSTGLEEVTERCSHCGQERTSTHVIPRLDDGRTATFSSSSSSSWQSGSSAGGTSGGGRSSGGGASGSW